MAAIFNEVYVLLRNSSKKNYILFSSLDMEYFEIFVNERIKMHLVEGLHLIKEHFKKMILSNLF